MRYMLVAVNFFCLSFMGTLRGKPGVRGSLTASNLIVWKLDMDILRKENGNEYVHTYLLK
jgi:hypothetical protein